ncbi:DUF6611 family protein [Mycobacterium terramassiliense]|uniref:Transmembrane protein n=1 Tax=Mycobacterium terramassiliense TaxID=1841859 RepID=A0A2U3NHM7_9MYCO|nr:DUF6611 family protein [Mycobacterium terramassiliense]SPM31031.1 hypothetical protein BN971_01363 [Mycobacterium terramassiliense]
MRKTVQRRPEPGILQLSQSAPAQPQWWSRPLEGAHQWGSFDATVGRYGVQRYRLTVYPPGSTTADRRLARLWRGWPITGAVLGLLAIMLLGDAAASPHTVLAIFVVAYVGIGALLFLRAGPVRVRVRSMSVSLLPNGADVAERRRHTEWRTLTGMLTEADRMLANGAISLVEHEAIWWEAYDRVEAIAHV